MIDLIFYGVIIILIIVDIMILFALSRKKEVNDEKTELEKSLISLLKLLVREDVVSLTKKDKDFFKLIEGCKKEAEAAKKQLNSGEKIDFISAKSLTIEIAIAAINNLVLEASKK